MDFHPNLRLLGRLELLEVYDYYDAPLFVSCRTATGAIYFAVSVSGSEASEGWLYVQVSRERFAHVRSGAIDLHTAFSQPENGIALLVEVPFDEAAEASAKALTSAELTDELLPARGEVLRLPTETLPKFDPLEGWATRTLRDAVGFRLEIPQFLRSEAPAKLLGSFLTGVQDTVNALAQALRGNQSRRGTFTRDVIAMNELSVVEAGGGSFALMLASTETPGLFASVVTPEVSLALEEFMQLLSVSGHAEQLRAKLSEQPRVAGNFLTMLRAIDKRVSSVSVEWSSPLPGRGAHATLSAVEVDAAIAVIEHEAAAQEKSFWVISRLVGANIDKKSFEVWSLEGDDRHYLGRIDDDAIESVNGAVIGNRYRALISQAAKLKPATGDVHEETTLLQLVAVR